MSPDFFVTYLPDRSFAKAGIDVDALAAQLQDEGAKSFVTSWNELMAVITSKSAALKEAVAS
jgi:transaldolase